MSEIRKPFTRQQVIDEVERRGGNCIPMFLLKWWGKGLPEAAGPRLTDIYNNYPDDIYAGWIEAPGTDTSPNQNPSYRWGYKDYSNVSKQGTAQNPILLDDWDELDRMLADFPDPNEPGILDHIITDLDKIGDRYKMGCFWLLFHEKLWTIRGMENLFCDYFEHMDELKRLGRRLLEFHKGIIDRFAELGFDGIFSSDDLGHQRGPMMSPAVFEELYLPLYKELADHIHSRGMHFWLHSCGDNTLLMDYLVEAGVDVFHPIQKGCMDEQAIIEKYSGKISFLYGIDVQHLLPDGSPDEVREEIIKMAKLLRQPGGGLLMAAGNGIQADTPIENIEMMFETVCNL